MQNIILLFLIISVSSCFKTSEQIRREKMVDSMNNQMGQSQKMTADHTLRVKELEDKVDSLSGKIEEIQHQSSVKDETEQTNKKQKNAQLTAQVTALKKVADSNKLEVAKLKAQIESQKKFIKKITAALGVATQAKQSKYVQANKLYEGGKYTQAKQLYLELLSENKINAAQRNLVWFNLGLINYMGKKYDTALIYFSKIYTKYPKSSYAPKSLLYIARSFKLSGKKDAAKESFGELIKKYPKSWHANKAKTEMKKI